VDAQDCGGSYELLDTSVQEALAEDQWCEQLPEVDGLLDADFDLGQAVLRGDAAEVHIDGSEQETWRLQRFGERSWRVLGPVPPGSFAGGG
jgi:hypothetical protein